MMVYDVNSLSLVLWDGEVTLSTGAVTIGTVDQGVGGSSAWKVDGSAVTQPVSGPLTDAQLRASAVPVSGTVAATQSGNWTLYRSSRSDTFTGAANGTAVDASAAAANTFAITVKGTGAAASAWDVRLEGSLDGTNFSQILQHTNTTGDGVTLFTGSAFFPCLYFRSRCASVTLGGATNLVVTIAGMQ